MLRWSSYKLIRAWSWPLVPYRFGFWPYWERKAFVVIVASKKWTSSYLGWPGKEKTWRVGNEEKNGRIDEISGTWWIRKIEIGTRRKRKISSFRGRRKKKKVVALPIRIWKNQSSGRLKTKRVHGKKTIGRIWVKAKGDETFEQLAQNILKTQNWPK